MGYNTLLGDVVISDYVSAVKSVGTTEVLAAVGGSNLSGRQEVIIYNDSSSVIYFGPTGVAISGTNKGVPIDPGAFVNLPFGASVQIYLIAASASNNVIIQELG